MMPWNGFKNNFDQWGPTDARILYPSFWFLPIAGQTKKVTGIPWPEVVGIYQGRRITFYWNKEKMEKLGGRAIEKWITADKKRAALWSKYRILVNQAKDFADKVEVKSARGLDRTDLGSLAGQWYKYMLRFLNLTLAVEIANFAAPYYLYQKLHGLVSKNKIAEILEALLAPERLSFHQQSRLELLQIAARTTEKKDLQNKLRLYAQKWYWLENSYYESRVLDSKYFARQAAGLNKKQINSQINHMKNYPALVKARKNKIVSQYRLSPEIAKLSKNLAFSIWWQDERKGFIWWANSLFDRFNDLSRKQFGVLTDDLMHYTAEEWRDLFRFGKKVSSRVLSARKAFTFIHLKNNKSTLTTGRKAKVMVKAVKMRSSQTEFSGVLAGIVVSKGPKPLTRGRVCLLFSARQGRKIKAGEILVAPMTSPDYINAMRKAKAIITDVGGLMSHAAIVSRELDIPCIVGTKAATKVLKDGDLVEVDANKGVVRILKKST